MLPRQYVKRHCRVAWSMAVKTWMLTGLLYGFNLTWSHGQTHPFLDNFSATVYQGEVYLIWTMRAGNTCNGIQIYRATDTLDFSRIGLIPGVCGSLTKAESYQYTDEVPVFNRVNYYRLELGAFGLSQIVAVDVPDISQGGYQIRPHPVVDDARIYFDKRENGSHQLVLYTQSGIAVHDDTTVDAYFTLEHIALPAGIYFFSIYSLVNSSIRIRGRMIVVAP